jgi:hypothetical protein
MTDRPPLDRWEEEAAIQELERLERLTETQRAAIEGVLRRVDQLSG